jgi:hypothetical protein
MTMTARRAASLDPAFVLAASFAGATLAPRAALADERSRVESIAAKGHISPTVPVEGGLALCVAAALLAAGLQRRSRQ